MNNALAAWSGPVARVGVALAWVYAGVFSLFACALAVAGTGSWAPVFVWGAAVAVGLAWFAVENRVFAGASAILAGKGFDELSGHEISLLAKASAKLVPWRFAIRSRLRLFRLIPPSDDLRLVPFFDDVLQYASLRRALAVVSRQESVAATTRRFVPAPASTKREALPR